jgi:hypothetical protein
LSFRSADEIPPLVFRKGEDEDEFFAKEGNSSPPSPPRGSFYIVMISQRKHHIEKMYIKNSPLGGWGASGLVCLITRP